MIQLFLALGLALSPVAFAVQADIIFDKLSDGNAFYGINSGAQKNGCLLNKVSAEKNQQDQEGDLIEPPVEALKLELLNIEAISRACDIQEKMMLWENVGTFFDCASRLFESLPVCLILGQGLLNPKVLPGKCLIISAGVSGILSRIAMYGAKCANHKTKSALTQLNDILKSQKLPEFPGILHLE